MGPAHPRNSRASRLLLRRLHRHRPRDRGQACSRTGALSRRGPLVVVGDARVLEQGARDAGVASTGRA